MLTATNSQAQSWSDLLNKDNISKVVNAITGTTESIDMTGTWNYKGSAVEFESDNLLMKAGGAAAATMAENKLNEQLSKIGIKDGQMSFTFNADRLKIVDSRCVIYQTSYGKEFKLSCPKQKCREYPKENITDIQISDSSFYLFFHVRS